ncbi:MAG: DUF1634 domain-containing protein [Chlorobiaceae bacterium]|nr:DUF1634 domain-containing protein [Chlorobiaceae bacterium]
MKNAAGAPHSDVQAGGKKEGGYADRVQLLYARTLDLLSHAVIVSMAAGYALYLTGLLPLSIPIETVAANWHLSAADMQAVLRQPSGWNFLDTPGGVLHGDVVSYMSVILLALATLICLAVAVVIYFSEKNRLFFAIALGQLLVLAVAASGIMAAGR